MSILRFGRSILAYGIGALLALQSVGVLLPSHAHAAGSNLRINEINWAGASTDATDQWIELVNTDVVAVDLSVTPYSLAIPSLSETIAIDTGTVAPGGFIVLHKESLAASTIHSLPTSSYLLVPTLTLPTVAAEYDLYDNTATLVDQVADTGSGLPFAGTSATTTTHAASMTRLDALVMGTSPANWYTARTIGAGFDVAAAEQYGTPGDANADLALPTGIVSPAKSTTLATPPQVNGTAATPATMSTVTFTRVSYDPNVSPFEQTYVAPVIAGAYMVDTTAPALVAGRFMIDVFSSDAAGNRSKTTRLFNDVTSTDTNYEVLPTTSTVPTPVITTPANNTLTNQPTVTVAGTLDPATTYHELDVLRNGSYYGTFPVSGSTFSFPVILAANQTNNLQVVGVKSTGDFSLPAQVMVVHDALAPNPVDSTKVVVNANQPGTHDSFFGNPGAAEAATTLFVYGDSAQTKLIATLTVAANGSFAQVDIGDNVYSSVYLVLQDAAGNRSTVTKIDNPTGFVTTPGALSPRVTEVGQTSASIAWTKVSNATRYRVKYKVAGEGYGATTDMCLTGNASCSFSTTITNLFTDTDYVFAIAAIDQFGNQSAFEEVTFHTKAAPVPAAVAIIEKIVPKAKAATRSTDVVTKVDTTPTPAPESGDVKSAATDATRNWTPWIVLGVLVAIAVLATAGYFYWFGGEAGEAALASVLAERAKRDEDEMDPDEKKIKSGPKPKKGGGNDRRW